MARFKSGTHDWISLLDISGPFLSLTSLGRAFPMGLETLEKGLRQQFQLAYEEWYEQTDKGIHQAWITWVLTAVLEYDDEVLLTQGRIPEDLKFVDEASNDTVRPTFLVVGNEGDPRLPILAVPKGQKLGQPLQGHRWVASPNQRMQALLKANQLTHGLVTNGSEWTLIHVRESDATGYITFRSDVLADEEDLLRAFTSLIGLRRVVGAAEGESLADLLLASRDDEEELTLDLGRQVRASVELLAREMDRLDEETGRELLKDTKNEDLYRGCLTVMMRLMFLLCAEERKLLPVDTSNAYKNHYAASTLLSQLEEEASEQGEEILERRHDAWLRLMANARLLHAGSPLPELQVTAYGGSLFDPAAYPFLERLKVNNRVTLHVLESLQYILVDGPTGKERRRVSFEALDVEQIGYVYEGLLDHTIHTASEPVLGLVGKKTYEPELSLSELDALRDKRDFIKLLAKETDRSEKAIKKLLDAPITPERESGLRAACYGKAELFERIKPWANLIRTDSMGRYQVYLEGSRYVSDSSERRGTGTHYTPRFLAEEMVQHTLEPLIVEGMAEGWAQDQWRKKSPTELLNLRVADIAMGSGAFLVAVCRFLSAKVVEAWEDAEAAIRSVEADVRLACTDTGALLVAYDPQRPDRKQIRTPKGDFTVGDPKIDPLPLDPEERLAVARGMVVDRCLYGVDINPMATEMAKLSLWLITMRKDKPFHFLNHALKCGDSLVGVTLDELERFSLKADDAQGGGLLLPWVQDSVKAVRQIRDGIRRIPGNTLLGVGERQALFEKAEVHEVALRVAADLLLTEAFTKATNAAQRKELEAARQTRLAMLQERPDREKASQLGSILGRPTFHFDLEFADVFAEGGFDAIVGNPPFVGGQKITDSMGTPFRDYIVSRIAHGKKGSADLCAYFFLRAVGITKQGGSVGLLATNTISEGDTREVGLDQLLKPEGERPPTATAYRAVKSVKWPSKSANLEVAKVWLRKGEFKSPKFLKGEAVETVSPMLDDEDGDRTPKRLVANEGLSFIGSYVLGMGFVLEIEQAERMLAANPDLSAVLFPYLNGEDLNNEVGQRPSRWVINFHDWPLGRVGQTLPISGEEVVQVVRQANPTRADDWFPGLDSRWRDPTRTNEQEEKLQKQWLQMGCVPSDYPDPVAADYPEALAIVEAEVRPERQRPSEKGPTKKGRNFQLRTPLAERFWHYGEKRPELYEKLRLLKTCLVGSRVSEFLSFAWCSSSIVIAERCFIVVTESAGMFAVLQSSLHEAWARTYSSTLESRLMYAPSDCFETFPLPELTDEMDESGRALDDARRAAMDARQIGLTAVSKLMHNPTVRDADIEALRQAVIANDAAVSASYGWEDLDLEHGFHDLGRGPRFTVSPAARKEMLRRLLTENHRRYAEEQAELAANPDAARPKKGKAKRKPDSSQGTMFGDGELSDGVDS